VVPALPRNATAQPRTGNSTTAPITEQDRRSRLFRIADDSAMGRESGSAGASAATAYVAAAFAQLGLLPASDRGSWFQEAPLWTVAADPSSLLRSGSVSFTPFRDFLLAVSAAPSVSLANSPVV